MEKIRRGGKEVKMQNSRPASMPSVDKHALKQNGVLTVAETTTETKTRNRTKTFNTYHKGEFKTFLNTDKWALVYIDLPLPGEKSAEDIVRDKFTEDQVKAMETAGVLADMIKMQQDILDAKKSGGDNMPSEISEDILANRPAIHIPYAGTPWMLEHSGKMLSGKQLEQATEFAELFQKRMDNISKTGDPAFAVSWNRDTVTAMLRALGFQEMTAREMTKEQQAEIRAKIAGARTDIGQEWQITADQAKIAEIKTLISRLAEKRAEVPATVYDLTGEDDTEMETLKSNPRPAGENVSQQ